ncbi:ATP-grasp domain-containing protein [Shimia sp. R10_1]|uniref:ATP-grasp domain-containing protein n=1 Tax=Shimia sp. R10_1 TaxID=2821095 RepID=UPI001AD96A27|nr:ATP-grasp domain-containing protein [Shimia sp. R10_1]MBO9473659.1 ATP-grasp domain-containing protein [Shimia sp. R10_1]
MINNNLVAIVLGGTAPHAVLLENLKARGYYTVLVDYFENPPAKKYADEHIVASTLDKDVVLNIAREKEASLVIATCVDQANTVAICVSQQLGLPRPYSYETATTIADKTLMKDKLVAHGLPTARHVYVDKGSDFEVDGLNYPLVVKPADTNGSAGVRKVNNAAELKIYLEMALDLSRVGRAIVEEFISGPELSIDCFIEQGSAKIVLVRRKYPVPPDCGVDQVMQSTGSIAPYHLSENHMEQAEKVLTKLAKVFELDNCPMLVQALLSENGISIIEFAARLSGGTGSATTKLISGFDALDASVDSFLQVPVTVQAHEPTLYSMTNTVYAKPGRFGSISGYQELIAEGVIEKFLHYKTKGMLIGSDMSTRSRVGAFLITGGDMKTVESRLRCAIRRLEVYDETGCKIMRKDLYDRSN